MSWILFKLNRILKDFFINSFWKSLPVLIILVASISLNVFLWYTYQTKIKDNVITFIFASGIILLNMILANYIWNREKIMSFFLISVGLFVQLLMLLIIRGFNLSF